MLREFFLVLDIFISSTVGYHVLRIDFWVNIFYVNWNSLELGTEGD